MIVENKHSGLEVQGNIQGTKIDMSVDMSAMGHIMNVLTDLYSDREAAVIRELSTNAWDAHVAAGNPAPIEVTTPSQMSPFFKVKDLGIGLSVEDIHDIYSKYGASTKRDSNEMVGCLGLGCKSPLTYTTQFTLVGVKDGVRCQVAISRDANGAGSMTVVDTSTTDEPNGVEIVVPVKSYNQFEQKAKRFFSFWEDGMVLLNGAEPTKLNGLALTDDLTVIEGHIDYVVMGNVAYPAGDRLHTNLAYNHALVARVEIGDVHFTPSREALQNSPETKATLDRVVADFQKAVPGAVQREIDACPNHPDALAAAIRWGRVLPTGDAKLTFRGKDIPKDYTISDGQAMLVLVPGSSHRLSQHQKVRTVTAEAWTKAVWVYNYDRPTFTPGQKKKMNKWAEDNSVTPQTYIMVAGAKPDTTWIAAGKVVDWKLIEAIKLPRNVATGSSGRIPGSYDAWVGDQFKYGVPGDDIDQDNVVCYVQGNRYAAAAYTEILSAEYGDDYTLVCLASNRIDKFRRLFPQAIPARDAVQGVWDRFWGGVTREEKLALVCQDEGDLSDLRRLDPTRVTDPRLKTAIRLAKVNVQRLEARRRQFRYFTIDTKLPNWDNPLDAYPLYAEASSYRIDADRMEHVYLYINAVYAANRKES